VPDFSNDREFTARWADFWRVTQRTIQRWRIAATRGEMPSPDQIDEMLQWQLTASRPPGDFVKRCSEIRLKRAHPAATGAASYRGAGPVDPEWQKFRETLAASGPKDHQAQIRDLEVFRDGYAYKLELAINRGAEAEIKQWNALLIDTSNAIRQAKLAADKLGLEAGELLPRPVVEHLLRALAYWNLRGIDAHLDALSRRLLNLSFPEEARRILEPELLSSRFLHPFARAAKVASHHALPPWAVATLRDATDDLLENGAAEFDNAFAAPLPPTDSPAPSSTNGQT
jgi:hypothetical protein